jgi:hypothetical protein
MKNFNKLIENETMRRVLIITIAFINISTYIEAKQVGSRIVRFPTDRDVGTLKTRDAYLNDTDWSMLQISDWTFLDKAQGDVNVPAGKDLRLETHKDMVDFSFLALLKPDDLQVLMMCGDNIADEELVHLKNLTALLGLDLSSTIIQGEGLVHLATLKSLRSLQLFDTQISDNELKHLSALKSLMNLSLLKTQIEGHGLAHLKNLTSLISLDLSLTPITDDSFVHLAEMTSLKELVLYDTDIGSVGLAHLKSLFSLELLILGNLERSNEYSPITDEGLAFLKDLDSLKELWLVKTQITDDGLAHLSNLRKLEVLFLSHTKLTGKGLAFLKEFPALKYLELGRTNIGNRGLANCKQWSDTLDGLQLDYTKISDADLAHLVCLKVLKRLDLSNTSITDAGLVHIKKLNSLENLNLDNTYITDDGLMLLKDLPNLQKINIMETSVTNACLENFKQISASKSVIVEWEISQIMSKPLSLLGKHLPDLKALNIEIPTIDTESKMLLVCFFDMEQRPSRNCLRQLSKSAQELKAKDVVVVAIQASKIDENKIDEWIKKYNIPFTVGVITTDVEKTRFTWGVRSLPWFILTNYKHIVRAEGFSLSELDEKISAITQR